MFGTGPSRQELKLKTAKRSGNPKKIIATLIQLLEVEVATTHIPHLEDEEIFGNKKQKLDLPLGDDGNSHIFDKVSQPRVQTRSRTAYIEFIGALVAETDKNELPHHVTTALDSDYGMSQWHIPRISLKSNCKCYAQQAATNVMCTARVAKGSKSTYAPIYHGKKTQYGSNKEIVTNF